MSKISELFKNCKGEFSTTATTQMLSVICLNAAVITALVLDRQVVAELAFAVVALSGWAGSSKGFIDYKNKTISKGNDHEQDH